LNKKDDLGFRQPVCDFCLVNNTCISKGLSGGVICTNADGSSAFASSTSQCGTLSASELRIIIIVGSIVGGILAIGGCYYYWNSKKKEEKQLQIYREERREDRRKANVNVEIQAQMRRATVDHHRNNSVGNQPGQPGHGHQRTPSVAKTQWSCSACTLLNQPEANKCSACGTVKPQITLSAPSHNSNNNPVSHQHNNANLGLPNQGQGHHARQPSSGNPSSRPSQAGHNRTPSAQISQNNDQQNKPIVYSGQLAVVPEIVFVPASNPASNARKEGSNEGEGEVVAVFVPA
jgi:hypothetical protein